MAFKRTASAIVSRSNIEFQEWMDELRSQHEGCVPKDVIHKTANTVLRKCDPKQYLLSHATIVASVDTFTPKGASTGRKMLRGVQIDVRWPDFRIKPECHEIINNNGDAWERSLLLSSYRSFIGAHNYLEHIQLPELSKGFIVDAIARDLGKTCYVDILVATDRKHKILIQDILSGQIAAMSMGCISLFTVCTACGNVAADDSQLCFPPNVQILKDDGTYRNISEIIVGDRVITHTGSSELVCKTVSRHYSGDLVNLKLEGIPNPVRCTPEHPIWILRPAQKCACGCDGSLRRTVEHSRGSIKSFQRRFLPGHGTRLVNPNPYSNVRNIQDFKSSFDDLTFSFVEAKDVIPGDYAGFPIPTSTQNSIDAVPDKARLIGYFLSEGCYIKRDNEKVGVTFTFGLHEYDSLARETEDLLNKVFGGKIRGSVGNWESLVLVNSIEPVKRNRNSRPVADDVQCPRCLAPSKYAKNSRHRGNRDECYSCKVCKKSWTRGSDYSIVSRRNKVARGSNDSGSTTVTLMSREAANFFFKHCGEYSNEKKISREVMLWDPSIQKNILFTWLNGDGHSAKTDGIKGSSSSYHLISQMHMIAARCGYYSRSDSVFNGKSVEPRNVVNGDGSVTFRDERGWLPIFHLTIPEPVGFTGETRFIDKDNLSVKMQGFFEGFKRVGNYLVHRVKSKDFVPYHGDVYNFEVSADSSYIVEGIAVHNCPCVQFIGKGQIAVDEDGVQFPISELIGHIQIPNSNQFIEASWVRNPAFRGAVRRQILNPDSQAIATKLNDSGFIYEIRRGEINLDGMKKAASVRISQQGDQAPAPSEQAPPADDSGADDDLDLGGPPSGGGGGDSDGPPSGGGDGGGGDSDGPPSGGGDGGGGDSDMSESDSGDDTESKPNINQMVEKAQQQLMEMIVNGLADKLAPKPEDVGTAAPAPSVDASNDNLIQSSAREFDKKLVKCFPNNVRLVRWASAAYRITRRGTNIIRKAGLTQKDLIVLSWIEDRVAARIYPPLFYKLAMNIGSIKDYPSETSFLAACRMQLGRSLSGPERSFFVGKGRISSLV